MARGDVLSIEIAEGDMIVFETFEKYIVIYNMGNRQGNKRKTSMHNITENYIGRDPLFRESCFSVLIKLL